MVLARLSKKALFERCAVFIMTWLEKKKITVNILLNSLKIKVEELLVQVRLEKKAYNGLIHDSLQGSQ